MLWFMVFPDVCQKPDGRGVVRAVWWRFSRRSRAVLRCSGRGFDEQPGGDALFVIEFFAFALDKALLNQDEGDFAAGRDFGDGLVAVDAVGEF